MSEIELYQPPHYQKLTMELPADCAELLDELVEFFGETYGDLATESSVSEAIVAEYMESSTKAAIEFRRWKDSEQ